MRKALAAITIFILGLSMIDVAISQSPGDSRPVVPVVKAQPSAQPSAVAVDEFDYPRTDGLGNLWTRIRSGAVSLSGNVTLQPGTQAANVTLPAGSPLPVQGTLPSGSPVGTLPLLPVLVAPSPPFVGTAAGLYVEPRANDGTMIVPDGYGMRVQGVNSHDANIDGGKPVQIGGYAHAMDSLPAPVSANGDAVRALHDLTGRYRALAEGPTYGDDALTNSPPVIIGAYAANALPSAVSADADAVRLAATRQGQLRTITDDNANAVGHSVKYEASHAGGGTEVTAKGSAGLLKWVQVSNPNTTDVWLQIHDATNPNVGTDVPLMAVLIPGGTGASNRGVYNQEFGPVGITFATAITYTVTTTAGGSTAPGSAVHVALGYK